MVARSAKSKEEEPKAASLGSYAVGSNLLMVFHIPAVAHTFSREFYHMVPLMGAFIL
jgi:hypothetical protein